MRSEGGESPRGGDDGRPAAMRRQAQATRRGLLLGIALGLGTLRDERGGPCARLWSTDLRVAIAARSATLRE